MFKSSLRDYAILENNDTLVAWATAIRPNGTVVALEYFQKARPTGPQQPGKVGNRIIPARLYQYGTQGIANGGLRAGTYVWRLAHIGCFQRQD